MSMRYYRRVSEGYHEWGDPTYWLEVNEAGDAERQIEEYPNGRVVSYDSTHREDEISALAVMVVDGDEDDWRQYAITLEEFRARWDGHVPSNRAHL